MTLESPLGYHLDYGCLMKVALTGDCSFNYLILKDYFLSLIKHWVWFQNHRNGQVRRI